MKKIAVTLSLSIGLGIFGTSVFAFPDKALTVVVPSVAGGPSDVLTRLLAKKIGEKTGQTVIVENRVGATGVIGGEHVAKSPPDGYMLLMITNLHAATAAVFSNLPYDPIKDFEPVVRVATTPMILNTSEDSPLKTVADVVEKAKSGEVKFGSAGVASVSQLSGELFSLVSKVPMTHIPYKGGAQATTDLLGQHITFMFNSPPAVMSLILSDKLRALAVTSSKRMPALPAVPTMAEAGYPEFPETLAWYGIVVAGGTPKSIVNNLNQTINEILKQPDMREQLAKMGADPDGGTPDSFAATIRAEIDNWRNLVSAGRIQRQ